MESITFEKKWEDLTGSRGSRPYLFYLTGLVGSIILALVFSLAVKLVSFSFVYVPVMFLLAMILAQVLVWGSVLGNIGNTNLIKKSTVVFSLFFAYISWVLAIFISSGMEVLVFSPMEIWDVWNGMFLDFNAEVGRTTVATSPVEWIPDAGEWFLYANIATTVAALLIPSMRLRKFFAENQLCPTCRGWMDKTQSVYPFPATHKDEFVVSLNNNTIDFTLLGSVDNKLIDNDEDYIQMDLKHCRKCRNYYFVRFFFYKQDNEDDDEETPFWVDKRKPISDFLVVDPRFYSAAREEFKLGVETIETAAEKSLLHRVWKWILQW